MQGDHIILWYQDGRTTNDKIQMFCKKHNATKSGTYFATFGFSVKIKK